MSSVSGISPSGGTLYGYTGFRQTVGAGRGGALATNDASTADQASTSASPTGLSGTAQSATGSAGATDQSGGTKTLNAQQQQVVRQLQSVDRDVRAHEAAHQAAGAGYTGGASFTYTRGPDGKQYATGGEVPVDSSSVPNNPQATIDKLQVVVRAALAPADPSSQDRSVAADAQARINEARQQLVSAQQSDAQKSDGQKSDGPSSANSSARAASAYRQAQSAGDAGGSGSTPTGGGLASGPRGRALSLSI